LNFDLYQNSSSRNLTTMKIAITSLFLYLAAGSAFAASSKDAVDSIEYDDAEEKRLDLDRDLDLFSTQYRNTPGIYVDTVDLHQTTDTTIMGQTMHQIMDMHIESETTVEARPEGGSVMDIETTRIKMDMDMGSGMSFSYDSDVPGDATLPGSDAFAALLDESQHAEMDEEGNFVAADGPGLEVAQQLKPSMSVEQTSRLLRLLPDYPVRPGDSWTVSFDMGEDAGHYEGTATLQGYKAYKHRDCAVITTEGTLEMDMSKVADLVGGVDLGGMSLDDALMESTIYFDHEMHLIRWTKSIQSMTIKMTNPIDGSEMSIPINQEITTNTFLKEEGMEDNE